MALKASHPVAILNIAELVLTIIISGLVAEMLCFVGTTDGWTKYQFISAIVYGYLMVDVIHTSQAFLPGGVHKTSRLIAAAAGSVLWIAASALMLEAADAGTCRLSEPYDRAVAGGVLGLILFLLHAIDAFLVYAKLEE